MKNVIILTLVVLLFGTFQAAQAYTARFNIDADYDSCYVSFGKFKGDECANLLEIEFQAGDSIWYKTNKTLNKDCKERYVEMFNRFEYFINGHKINVSVTGTMLTIPDPENPQSSITLGKHIYYHNDEWHCFIPTDEFNEDMEVGIRYKSDMAGINWLFNTELCTIVSEINDDTLSITPNLSFGYDAAHARYPMKVIPKEGYEITSISIDTIRKSLLTTVEHHSKYEEHIKYAKGDAPINNDWLSVNNDGSVTVMPIGHCEVDGILYSRNSRGFMVGHLYGDDFDLTSCIGSCVTVIIGETGINETAISSKKISPNPSNSSATLTLNLENAGNLQIILTDLLGKELFEIHNKFTDAGNFTKTFSTANLVKGTYYLKIFNNGSFTTEKLVVN